MKSSGRVAEERRRSPVEVMRPEALSRQTRTPFRSSAWTRVRLVVVGPPGGEEGEVAHPIQQLAHRRGARPGVDAQEVDGGGAQLAVALHLLGVPALQLVQPLAEVSAVDLQVAVEIAPQLGHVVADVVLGEDEDVVAHAGQEPGKELLLDLLGGAGQPLDEVVGGRENAVEVALEHPVLDRVAVAAADLQVLAQDALRRLLQEARHLQRMVEPEDGGVLPAVARVGGVFGGAQEEGAVGVPGGGVLLPVVRLAGEDGELYRLLGEEVLLQAIAQSLHAGRKQDGKPLGGGGALVLEEDRARLGERLVEVGEETADLFLFLAQEVERPREELKEGRRVHRGANFVLESVEYV
jgi:hypothetical protein